MVAKPAEVLSDDEKYERLLASDSAWDGRFYVGVVTTGIYCRPSCRVRKPLRENVRFFDATDEARAAGLRPCRRCHPDDFARGVDVDRDEIEALLSELKDDPSRFPDVDSLVERSGYGATRLFETFRRVLGVTPAAALNAARIDHACRLLRETDESVLAIALACGYQSTSVFHRRFRQATGMTPREWREDLTPAAARPSPSIRRGAERAGWRSQEA